jgi:mevalonate kinase
MGETLRSRRWPFLLHAPGKAILFGEHAVVRGRTALVMALDRGTELSFEPRRGSGGLHVNGLSWRDSGNPYLAEALRRFPGWAEQEVALTVRSALPRASGLGSSAAFTVGLVGGFLLPEGDLDRGRLARESYRIERSAQGVGSPVDTSASAAGGILAVGSQPRDGELWEIPPEGGSPAFHVSRVRAPAWGWAAAFTGVAKATGPVVRKVGEVFDTPRGQEILDGIARVALAGERALAREDRADVGALMGENHRLLSELGVSHPRLEALIRAAGPFVEGVKLTGAGGGGSVLALPREGQEPALLRAWARAGGVPFLLAVPPAGAGPV